ncbi:hypothetical protein [uncultured Clostridium sp.]|uniref:hypothetical protein n=1 Tax=uncultured Clostridium sp. TaxID=59620 RepID=UPI00280AD174|nr:hypothetical protein [uncultured Clostridium sp.]
MKYGIDINSEKILNFISERLKERGHFIIDLTERNNVNNGRVLLKKVLIANVTNIDLYFAIDFKKEASFCEIFFNEDDHSKKLGEKLIKIIGSRLENIVCKNGSHLYLIKNIKSSAIYVSSPIEYKDIIENLLDTNELIDILESKKNN